MIRRFLAGFMLLSLCLFAAPAAVSAAPFDAFGGVDCNNGGQSDSAVCKDKQSSSADDPIAGPNGALAKITNLVAYIAGVAAIIIFMVGALRFVTSGGDSAKAASARQTILGAVIGLAVIVLARSIIFYVIGRLN